MTSIPHEQAIVIQGKLPIAMLGVLHSPCDGVATSGTGVVIVNGGAQYRAGAHRLFVQLARHLAARGHTVMRFDFPGQGDSPGESLGFEKTAKHIEAAIDDLLQRRPYLKRTTLLGLCDGASASLLYLHVQRDVRVTHLALINPWVHDERTEARAQIRHYYRQRLLMPDFWRKLANGGVGCAALREMAQKWYRSLQGPIPVSSETFQSRMGRAWRSFNGRILLVLSERDQTAQEFRIIDERTGPWNNWKSRQGLHLADVSRADHTFSQEAAQSELLHLVCESLQI